jgi:uncharacterized MAPEG superfamily protein
MNISIADPNVRTLIEVDTLLVLGLMFMSNYTSFLRLVRKVYATPEDYTTRRIAPPAAQGAGESLALRDDPIARSRRIHQNHLENVLPFLFLSALYAITEPAHLTFATLLWSFLLVRVIYTVAYARGLQPHRTIAYTVGALLAAAMVVLTIVAALSG